MCDFLRGVDNENTQKALLYRKEGNIVLAKKFLTKAALEDDDSLAHFLILHAMQTGGFGIEKTDIAATENQEELLLLKKKQFYPALLYFRYEEKVEVFPYEYRALSNVVLHKQVPRDINLLLEHQVPIYYIGCLFLAEFLALPYYIQWMAEFAGDAECQYIRREFKLAAKQMHFKARKEFFVTQLCDGTLVKALKYCDNYFACENFWLSTDTRIQYLLGKKIYPKRYFFSQSARFDPNIPRDFYETVWDNVHDATVTWLLIAKLNLGLPKDVYRIVGNYVWQSRLIEPEIWASFTNPRKELEKKSWWMWCKRGITNLINTRF